MAVFAVVYLLVAVAVHLLVPRSASLVAPGGGAVPAVVPHT